MANLGHFDADGVNTDDPFAPIPPDEYVMLTTNSEIRTTKSGSGKYIALEHEIVEGDYKGRKVWNNLNLWNTNPQAVQIATRHLACLCKATGKRQITDTAEIHGIPFRARLSIDTSGAKPQNRIDDYLFEDTVKQTVATTQSVADKVASSPSAPWGQG
jgi:hypothetical protein